MAVFPTPVIMRLLHCPQICLTCLTCAPCSEGANSRYRGLRQLCARPSFQPLLQALKYQLT